MSTYANKKAIYNYMNAVNSNSLRPIDAYLNQSTRPPFVQIMSCCLLGTKTLSGPMLACCWLHYALRNLFRRGFYFIQDFHSNKCVSKCRLPKFVHFGLASMCQNEVDTAVSYYKSFLVSFKHKWFCIYGTHWYLFIEVAPPLAKMLATTHVTLVMQQVPGSYKARMD